MKYILFILCLAGCTNATRSHLAEVIDTSQYAILKLDSNSEKYIFKETVQASTLSYQEIKKIEELISRATSDYNKSIIKEYKTEAKNLPYIIIHESIKYHKQFISVINVNGEKEVWVNCFSAGMRSDWKQRIVAVADGGSSFFQIKINLTKGTAYELTVNGVG